VEGQAIAFSLRYEERPKRIPLLIRLPRDMARCLALKGRQQPQQRMTNNSACWYLFPRAKAALASQFDCAFLGTTDTQGLGIDMYNLLAFRFVYPLRERNSHYGTY